MAVMRLAASFALLVTTAAVAAAEVPSEIAAKGETVVFQAHAEGAQIYDCKADAAGKLVWQFREPIATLNRGQRNRGQAGCARARRRRQGYSLVEAGRVGPEW
jgi:hypothetical protein